MTGPDFAAVLSEHRIVSRNLGGFTGCWGCLWQACPGGSERGRKAHRLHVEECLKGALVAWLDSDEAVGAAVDNDVLGPMGILTALARKIIPNPADYTTPVPAHESPDQ